MTSRHTNAVRVTAVALATGLALAACSGGTARRHRRRWGQRLRPEGKKIKLVAAEYSKDHTAAFWKQFAEKYKAKTGTELEVQVVSWDTIDQTSARWSKQQQPPDILNLNAYASYAKDGLLYNSDEVLPDAAKSDLLDAFVKSGTTTASSTASRTCPPRGVLLQQGRLQEGGIAAPPKTWDEFEADAKRSRPWATAPSRTTPAPGAGGVAG